MSYFALTQDIVPLVVLLALFQIEKERNVLTEKNVLCAQSAYCPCFCKNILRNNTVNLNNNYPTTYH